MTAKPPLAPERLKRLYAARFGATERSALVAASAPGRVELAGNHTDHQGGRAIAAAIDRRTYAAGAPNGSGEVRVVMDGFGEAVIDLAQLGPRPEERGESVSLVRGMAAAYAEARGTLRGLNLAVCSDIPAGCGLSSSAAFEMALGAIVRALCDGPGAPPHSRTALALEGARVERAYFGKPCGAQDQLASVYGGVIALDFADEEPSVTPVAWSAQTCGHTVFLVDCRCNHALFPDEYAAVPADMFAVARHFGRARLQDVPYPAFLGSLADVRAELGDRAALRALHYFEETRRVTVQQRTLEGGDFATFLQLVRQSGASSAQFLQNVSPRADGSGDEQPAMVILALCAHLLGERGAWRIHGGGFGGSVLAFVPSYEADAFRASMDALLGYEACLPVSIGALGICVERLG